MDQEQRFHQFGLEGFDSSVSSEDQAQQISYDQHHHHQQEGRAGLGNISGITSPLRLKLTKTKSFLELVESKISKKYNSTMTDETSDELEDQESNEGVSEKLRASHTMALRLEIGSFERKSIHGGDLVAKCYFAKRKLVWEMLDGGLKNKIEINWSDISAITAEFPENLPSVVQIQLSRKPSFQRESDPIPRKHTLWHPTSDFTGNQASIYRRHCIQFREGEFEKHYEKLLQCDKRLLVLSQKPFPQNDPPFFVNKNLIGCQPVSAPQLQLSQLNNQPGYAPAMQFFQVNTQPGYAPVEQFPQFDTKRRFPVVTDRPNQMLQPSMNAFHLSSSIPPYMMGREYQVTEQSLYPYDPNQVDHALHRNASIFQAFQGGLLSEQVDPVHAPDMVESWREPNANTNNSWNTGEWRLED